MAVGVNGNLHRRPPDAIDVVLANERLYTGSASDSDSSGLAVFNDDKALLAVSIELLRLAYFVFLDDALNFQAATDRIFEEGAALGMRVHFQHEFGGRDAFWI